MDRTEYEARRSILVKDLCARLPYGVMVHLVYDENTIVDREMGLGSLHDIMFDNAEGKPYLRPVESMTEEESEEFKAFHCVDGWHPEFYQAMCNLPNINNMIDWLDKKMFDYRGLIPKGLAIEASENMYKN
jgi:hypothetical protein